MFLHLANPWILARLALGVAASALALAAGAGAASALAGYRVEGPADERTLALERRSELVSSALRVAFTLELAASLLTVLAADRLSGSIRGAMCAYGVFSAHPWGWEALEASLLAACGAAAWLSARAVDARLAQGSLVRTTSALALAVAPLIVLDTVTSGAFLLGLDLDVVSSCCSVTLDARGAGFTQQAEAVARAREVALGVGGALASLVSSVALWRRPTPARGALAGALALAGGWASARVVVDVIAPYAYEAPHHRCAFCLLHREATLAGPLLLGALVAAVLLGVATVAAALLARRGPLTRAASEAVLWRLGRASAVAWALASVSALVPVVGYAWTTGTLALFG